MTGCFFRNTIFSFFVLVACCARGQTWSFEPEAPVNWPSHPPGDLRPVSAGDTSMPLVIIDEHTSFCFFRLNDRRLFRTVLLQVNNELGRKAVGSFIIPESFDPVYDQYRHPRGMQDDVTSPNLEEFRIMKVAARKFNGKAWQVMKVDMKYRPNKRLHATGELKKDEDVLLLLQDIRVGDIVEIHYEMSFKGAYGTNLFYFNSTVPKKKCTYDFIYSVDERFAANEFIMPLNFPDSVTHVVEKKEREMVTIRKSLALKDLPPINYPRNSSPSRQFPHVHADFTYYLSFTGTYNNVNQRVYEYNVARPKHIAWMVRMDTTEYKKVYDKQYGLIRKFLTPLPVPGKADSSKFSFCSALTESFNGCRYISACDFYYNHSAWSAVYSGEHLLKGRLVQHQASSLYRDIFNQSGLFYYEASAVDGRLGVHNSGYRVHGPYERFLYAVPAGRSFMYMMPRYDGVEYHLNELPFYLEDTRIALTGRNFQKDSGEKFFALAHTPGGRIADNLRSEHAEVRLSLDSAMASIQTKLTLSGQFSTLLRHLYTGRHVDSSVRLSYFRRCTDKPGSLGVKTEVVSQSADFPFRCKFSCQQRVRVNTKALDLSGWFSFPFSRKEFQALPLHDFYQDFVFSDTYSFLLKFDRPVKLLNAEEFTRKHHDDYFGVESDITRNDAASYVMRVKVVVKRKVIPKADGRLLLDFADLLDSLNAFVLRVEPM